MKSLVSEEYKSQLRILHEDQKFFSRGTKVKFRIEPYLEKYNPQSLIDFGCGKGGLFKELAKTIKKTAGYDPGVPEFDALPNDKFESLICLDVLEHIEPDRLDDTLKVMDSLFTKSSFLIVASYPAKKYLPDGRNAHLILESYEWWVDKLSSNIKGKIVWSTNTPIIKTPKRGPALTGFEYIFIIEK